MVLVGSDIKNLRLLDKALTHSTFILKFYLIFLNKLVNELPILFQGQLAIVIYFNDYCLFCFRNLTLHVKLTHEWVFQNL